MSKKIGLVDVEYTLCDCIEGMRKLPDRSVDMVMFDAPFYQEMQEGGKRDKMGNYKQWMTKMVAEFDRLLVDGGNIAYLNAPIYIYQTIGIFLERFIFRNDIPLVRPSSFNPAWMLGMQHNLLVLLCKGSKKGKWNGSKTNHNKASLTDVWSDIKYRNGYRHGSDWHPEAIQKDLTTRCITLLSNEGDFVLDPCMGSATTAIVCIENGRRFVGFEKNEKYFRICERRIKEALQPTIF